MTSTTPIERAIAEAGSETKLAKATGYSQVAINKAKKAGKASPELAIAIAKATTIPLEELMPPDVFQAVRDEVQREAS